MCSKGFLAAATTSATYSRLTAGLTVPGVISSMMYHSSFTDNDLQAHCERISGRGCCLQNPGVFHGCKDLSGQRSDKSLRRIILSNSMTLNSSSERYLVSTRNTCKRNVCTGSSDVHQWHSSYGKNREFIPDLQRFLCEIGTDPKEGRYWLKQFKNNNQKKPFAVIEIDPEVIADAAQLEHFASAVSFLQRNSLRPILVLGDDDQVCQKSDSVSMQERKATCIRKCCALSDSLSEQNLESCILFAGSNVIEVESTCDARVKLVRPHLIQWCMMRHAVPIVPTFGETAAGQIMCLKTWEVTSAVARQLQPLKVIKVNSHGGFQDEDKRIIANINLPFDLQAAKDKPWCTEPVIHTIKEVSSLLTQLPEHTSMVITAADKMLQELFTHHGSGTFLKFTEPILVYNNLENVDIEQLRTLFTKSFNKKLSESYFDDIKNDVHTVFVSERYTAAAVILRMKGCDVPYLCKLAVSAQAQGEGTGEILWEAIQRHFKQLFWRSRGNNPVNRWYFQKCGGSWDTQKWTVFWYGISEPSLSAALVSKAFAVPESFYPQESTLIEKANHNG